MSPRGGVPGPFAGWVKRLSKLPSRLACLRCQVGVDPFPYLALNHNTGEEGIPSG
jgi:hypothetical protein